MFGRKTLEFMLICIGDEMRDSLLKGIIGSDTKVYFKYETGTFTLLCV